MFPLFPRKIVSTMYFFLLTQHKMRHKYFKIYELSLISMDPSKCFGFSPSSDSIFILGIFKRTKIKKNQAVLINYAYSINYLKHFIGSASSYSQCRNKRRGLAQTKYGYNYTKKDQQNLSDTIFS